MTDWLGRDDRDDEDAAFILPLIAWGRATPQAEPVHSES